MACRRKGAKRALIRIVRGPSGGVDVDPSGRAPGRGAYLCPERRCWDTALRGARLSGALRATLRPEERERLGRHAATLPAAEEDASDGR